jgi:hypothetical protein
VSNLSPARVRAVRAGLLILAVSAAYVGLWALIAPHSFYGDFPGGGRSWVAPIGAYDEHLVRDVGSFETALAVLAVFAAATLDRRLVQGTCVAFVVSGLPHLIYHAANTGPLSTTDNLLSLAGLAAGVVIPLALLPLTGTRARRPG